MYFVAMINIKKGLSKVVKKQKEIELQQYTPDVLEGYSM
jgi:hypothetical protein